MLFVERNVGRARGLRRQRVRQGASIQFPRASAPKHSTPRVDSSGVDSTAIAVRPTDPDEQLSVLVAALIAKGDRAKATALLAAYDEPKAKPETVVDIASRRARGA